MSVYNTMEVKSNEVTRTNNASSDLTEQPTPMSTSVCYRFKKTVFDSLMKLITAITTLCGFQVLTEQPTPMSASVCYRFKKTVFDSIMKLITAITTLCGFQVLTEQPTRNNNSTSYQPKTSSDNQELLSQTQCILNTSTTELPTELNRELAVNLGVCETYQTIQENEFYTTTSNFEPNAVTKTHAMKNSSVNLAAKELLNELRSQCGMHLFNSDSCQNNSSEPSTSEINDKTISPLTPDTDLEIKLLEIAKSFDKPIYYESFIDGLPSNQLIVTKCDLAFISVTGVGENIQMSKLDAEQKMINEFQALNDEKNISKPNKWIHFKESMKILVTVLGDLKLLTNVFSNTQINKIRLLKYFIRNCFTQQNLIRDINKSRAILHQSTCYDSVRHNNMFVKRLTLGQYSVIGINLTEQQAYYDAISKMMYTLKLVCGFRPEISKISRTNTSPYGYSLYIPDEFCQKMKMLKYFLVTEFSKPAETQLKDLSIMLNLQESYDTLCLDGTYITTCKFGPYSAKENHKEKIRSITYSKMSMLHDLKEKCDLSVTHEVLTRDLNHYIDEYKIYLKEYT